MLIRVGEKGIIYMFKVVSSPGVYTRAIVEHFALPLAVWKWISLIFQVIAFLESTRSR